MKVLSMIFAVLCLAACDPEGNPILPPPTCATPSIPTLYGPCPQEIRENTVVAGSGIAPPRAISTYGGGYDYSAPRPGICIYTDPCGTAWQVSMCYLADGTFCPQ
jgi:hypothetical protein